MVDQRVNLQGWISLKQLDRVQGYLLDSSGEVEVKLRFDKDEIGVRFIAGSIQAAVSMECQRCLQPARIELKSDFKLGIVFNEDAEKNLPGYYDPLLLSESELELWQMVEEELILCLPISATHPKGECGLVDGYNDSAEQDEGAEEQVPNPFQVLQQLKDIK